MGELEHGHVVQVDARLLVSDGKASFWIAWGKVCPGFSSVEARCTQQLSFGQLRAYPTLGGRSGDDIRDTHQSDPHSWLAEWILSQTHRRPRDRWQLHADLPIDE